MSFLNGPRLQYPCNLQTWCLTGQAGLPGVLLWSSGLCKRH